MKRLLTALVLIPTISYFVIWAPFWAFAIVLTAIAMLCYREYDTFVANHGIAPPGWIGYLVGLAILHGPHPHICYVLGALLFLALSLRSDDLKQALPRAGAGVLGLLYTFGTWRTGMELRAADPWWLFFACALNWVGDSAAYYVGRAIGKRKLAPVVSPGKSWEGAIASVVGSMAFGALVMPQFLPAVPAWKFLLLAGVANVAGQVGDLCESAMKRGAGMKDSSNLLPGHGGWLDRVDSSLFAMPVVFLLKEWLVGG
jgi:phosphatidate cytidylyltransferase